MRITPHDHAVTLRQRAVRVAVEVRARVTGILLKREYREGAPVQKGQALFSIDPAPFQVALARAEADLAGAQARLAQARRNAVRLKPLIESKAASQKDYDDAVSAEQISEADLKAAQAINDRIYPVASVFYAQPWVDMHNRMKEALVLMGKMQKAVVRPPLVKIERAEIERIRKALMQAGLLYAKAQAA